MLEKLNRNAKKLVSENGLFDLIWSTIYFLLDGKTPVKNALLLVLVVFSLKVIIFIVLVPFPRKPPQTRWTDFYLILLIFVNNRKNGKICT